MHALALVTLVALGACNKTSENAPMVTAPVGSGAPAAPTPSPPPAASAPPSASDETAIGPGPTDDISAGAASAQYRGCKQDSDCVAVPRVGCCNNGWLEAVSATQKDAYAKSFVCPTSHPICPMFIVRDTRTPKCDAGSHLCTMVGAHP